VEGGGGEVAEGREGGRGEIEKVGWRDSRVDRIMVARERASALARMHLYACARYALDAIAPIL